MKEKVEAALNRIRPRLQADGGDIKLIDVKDGIAHVKLTGACSGCPMAQATMTQGVERVIKESVPEIKKVVAV